MTKSGRTQSPPTEWTLERQWYVRNNVKRMSVREIAENLGVPEPAVYRFIVLNNVDRRRPVQEYPYPKLAEGHVAVDEFSFNTWREALR